MIQDSDTVRDTLPYYLKAEAEQAVQESWRMSFEYGSPCPADTTRLFSDLGESATLSAQLLPAGGAGTAMPFSPWVHSAFFLLFLLCFTTFAFVFRWDGAVLKGNFRNALSVGRRSVSVYKSQVTGTEAWGEFYLVIQAILIFAILLFSWLWSQGLSVFSMYGQLVGFAGIFAGLALLICLKIVGYRLIGTFFLQSEMENWVTFYSRMMEILGIIFFLPAVLYVYLQEVRNIILTALILLFFISRLLIYMGLLNIFVKNKISPFYFFIYLCGTEIAPYLLLYKGVLIAITIAEDNII
ncbi:MAG: DUF4271 domain-containing protein [Proteiniphilum sp.]|jgi:hypothetical protein|nr:DUF4271 domain-containing protein [Proteiniphilum sp.]